MAVKELNEKRLQLAAQIKEFAERQATWTSEDQSAWDKVNGEYDTVAKQINDELAANQRATDVSDRLKEIEDFNKSQRGDRRLGFDEGARRAANPELAARLSDEVRALAVQGWVRSANGLDVKKRHREAARTVGININARELRIKRDPGAYFDAPAAWTEMGGKQMQRALNVTSANLGKETIPKGFYNHLEAKLLQYGGPRSVCSVIRTDSGNDLPMPRIDDTANSGALLAEATTIGSSVDPATAEVTLQAFKYSSTPVQISSELLSDSAMIGGGMIFQMLGVRLGRAMGIGSTTGTGSSQPAGIVTNAAAGVSAASATAIAADELIDLVHSVDPAYRASPSAGWMLHDNIIKALRKLKDTTNQYLWQPGMQAGVPDRLFNYPVTINQHMASAITTGLRTIIFGDFSKFFIREVGDLRLRRLDELYAATDQVGFVAFQRWDSDTIETSAIKRLTQA